MTTTLDVLPPRLTNTEDEEDFPQAKRDDLAYLIRYETMIRQQEAEDMATIEHFSFCMQRFFSTNKSNEELFKTEVSYHTIKEALNELDSKPYEEAITTDNQLMMTLRMLAKNADHGNDTITITEILHCYQTALLGVMNMKRFNPPSIVRERSRNRILSMLELFQPKHNHALLMPIDSDELEEDQKPSSNSKTPYLRFIFILLALVAGSSLAWFYTENSSFTAPTTGNTLPFINQRVIEVPSAPITKAVPQVKQSKPMPKAGPTNKVSKKQVKSNKALFPKGRTIGLSLGVFAASAPIIVSNFATAGPILASAAAGIVAASVVHFVGRSIVQLIQKMLK